MLWIVLAGRRGLPRSFATGSPASETKVKLRNVERISTGML